MTEWGEEGERATQGALSGKTRRGLGIYCSCSISNNNNYYKSNNRNSNSSNNNVSNKLDYSKPCNLSSSNSNNRTRSYRRGEAGNGRRYFSRNSHNNNNNSNNRRPLSPFRPRREDAARVTTLLCAFRRGRSTLPCDCRTGTTMAQG
jgi:hypothetical protein